MNAWEAPFITSGGIGTFIVGEGQVTLIPRNWTPGGLGMVWCHGANAAYSDAVVPENNQRKTLIALAKAGVLVVCPDNGGKQTWGNDQSITAVGQARAYLVSKYGANSSKILLGGASMGALVSTNYARQHLSEVLCMVHFIPVRDLDDFHANNRLGGTSLIDTAYGGAYSEATHGAVHNPMNYVTHGDLAGLPMQSWYAGADTVCLPSIEAAFASAQGSCETHNLGAYDHGAAGLVNVDPSLVVQFVLAHAS